MFWFLFYAAVYVIGYLIAYVLIRRDFRSAGYKWTQGDRLFALSLSFFSWATVLAGLLKMLSEFIREDNTPATW